MIASVGSRLVGAGHTSCHAGHGERAAGRRRTARPAEAQPDPAQRQQASHGARPARESVDGFLRDDAPLPVPARAAAAARAFAEGNCFVPGLLVDRFA